VKQQCVLNEYISNNDNFSWMSIGVLYALIKRGEESKSLERQRKSNMTRSISTKFRKIVQENRVGVFTSCAALVDNIS
jgi:hypothetical protein